MQNYQMLAEYNAWANRLLYAAVADLTKEELHRDTVPSSDPSLARSATS